MEDFDSHLEQRRAHRFAFDMGKIISDGFDLWKKVSVPMAGALMIIALPLVLMYTVAMPLLGGKEVNASSGNFLEMMRAIQETQRDPVHLLKASLMGFVMVLITAPFQAGMLAFCHRADKEGEGKFNDFFAYFKGPYWGRIVGAALLITLLNDVFSVAFSLLGPGGGLLLWPVNIAIYTFTCYSTALIIFADRSLGDAFRISFQAAAAQFFTIVLLAMLFYIFMFCGLLLCIVGIIFSASFIPVLHYVLYRESIGFPAPPAEEGSPENYPAGW